MNKKSMLLKKAIKENDLVTIYEYLEKTITRFKNSYGAIFDNDYIRNIFFDETFTEIVNEYRRLGVSDVSLFSYYSTGIANRIRNIVKNYSDNDVYCVMSRYIEKEIEDLTMIREEDYITVLEKIDILCLRLGINLSSDVTRNIFSNSNKIYSIVEAYVNSYTDTVNDNTHFDKLEVSSSTGTVTSMFLELYCKGNGIKMEYISDSDKNQSCKKTIGDYSSLDSVNMYLDDINAIPLLSPLEEVKLFFEYRAGNSIARTKIIEANLRLVVPIAKRYYTSIGGDFSDLLEYGNMGLFDAVEKFDEYSGNKFSTYANYWIKQRIVRNMDNMMQEVRVSHNRIVSAKKYNSAKRELELELGREVQDCEIAEYLDWTLDKVKKIQKAMPNVISLNKPIGEDDKYNEHGCSELGEIIPSDWSVEDRVIENISKDGLHEAIFNALNSLNLSDRDMQVFLYRFGFTTGKKESLKTITSELKVARETVRSIELRTLKKLRMNKRGRELAYFLDDPEGALANICNGNVINDGYRSSRKSRKGQDEDSLLNDEDTSSLDSNDTSSSYKEIKEKQLMKSVTI